MKKENLRHIKFDNKSIESIKTKDLDWTYINKAGETKGRRKILIPFLVPKRSILKGLKLCIHRDTGLKYFWLSFWFSKRKYTIRFCSI